MSAIKLWDGVCVTTRHESKVFDDPQELWRYLKMDAEVYHDYQVDIIRNLFAFGKVYLSEAYHGELVVLTTVTNKEE